MTAPKPNEWREIAERIIRAMNSGCADHPEDIDDLAERFVEAEARGYDRAMALVTAAYKDGEEAGYERGVLAAAANRGRSHE